MVLESVTEDDWDTVEQRVVLMVLVSDLEWVLLRVGQLLTDPLAVKRALEEKELV